MQTRIVSRTLILQEISKTQNQHQEEFCAFSEVTPLYRSVGCARSKLQCHTAPQKLEVISLDAGLRIDDIPSLTLWDKVIEICHCAPHKIVQPKGETRCRLTKPNMHNPIQCRHNNVIPTKIDHIPPNTTHSGPSAMLCVFEDN